MSQVRLPRAFESWFSGSKIAEPDGTPMIVYHGSAKGDPGEFHREGGLAGHWGDMWQAITKIEHDHEDGKVKNFKRAVLVPAYLAMKNPVRMTDVHFDDGGEMLEDLLERNILTPTECESLGDDLSGFEGVERVVALLGSKGYDGIVYDNRIEGEGDSYIPFSPEQIHRLPAVSATQDVLAIRGEAVFPAPPVLPLPPLSGLIPEPPDFVNSNEQMPGPTTHLPTFAGNREQSIK